MKVNSLHYSRVAKPILTALFAASFALAQSSTATTKLDGKFVLIEEGYASTGAPITSLAGLTFAENGAVSGSRVVKSVAETRIGEVNGSYAFDTDGSVALTLNAATTDADGNEQTSIETYRMMANASGEYSVLRTNPGFYTIGKLQAAGALAVSGARVLAERAPMRPFARLASLTFDGTGGVRGYQVAEASGVMTRADVTGTYTSENSGFRTLTITYEQTDAAGETASVKETYLFLTTADDVAMIRVDNGATGLFLLER